MDAVIFDFDGVIANSLHYIREIFVELADKHGFRRIDDDEEFMDLVNKNLVTLIRELKIPKGKLAQIFLDYKEKEKKMVKHVELYPGMKDLIKKLGKKNSGKDLYIVSSNHKEIIELVLKKNRLLSRFKGILGAEFSYHKEEKLKHLLKMHYEGAYFITDTEGDVIEAQRVPGLSVIAVSWGYHTWNEKDKVKPDVIVNDVKELSKILFSS